MPADRHYAQLWLAFVPEEVRKSVTSAELNDRVAEASRLSDMANSAPGAAQRQELKERAQRIISAAPRAATERLVADKIAKAAQLGSSVQADMLRRQAQDWLDQNPPAPRRGAAVRKAEAGPDITPVFNADGQLIGIVDTDKITLVSGRGQAAAERMADPAAAPPDAGAGQQVSKAVRAWDQHGRMLVTDQRHIRKTAAPLQTSAAVAERYKRKATGHALPGDEEGDDQGHGTDGTPPEIQARRGSVQAGGTTGAGKPRKLEGAAAALAAAPQAKLPGDVPDRAVIKALNPGWTAVHDWTGALVGAVRQSHVIATPRAGTVAKSQVSNSHANVYNASRRKVGMAPLSHIIPVADLRKALGTSQPRRRTGR